MNDNNFYETVQKEKLKISKLSQSYKKKRKKRIKKTRKAGKNKDNVTKDRWLTNDVTNEIIISSKLLGKECNKRRIREV